MPGDILNHQPAAPSTILPGTWLIDLPPSSAIYVRRYRSPASTEDTPNSGGGMDDPLEKAWRGINTSPGSSVRNVLKDPCTVICALRDLEGVKDAKGRELWVFCIGDADDAGESFGGLVELEREYTSSLPCFHLGSRGFWMTDGPGIDHPFAPVEPAQLLNCPRHGHDLSCLLRPSTSQRPLKSCDVRFEPAGEDKIVWENLGQAIVEKLHWNRGRRVIVKR